MACTHAYLTLSLFSCFQNDWKELMFKKKFTQSFSWKEFILGETIIYPFEMCEQKNDLCIC